MISNFTITASAGTATYNKVMNNKDQPTEVRASATEGVV
jgi:hypothetical protein